MNEDSLAPNPGAGGSRCNAEVWRWSVERKGLLSGSSAGRKKDLHGIRVQRKRVIGTVERYRDESAARSAVTVLLQEINSHMLRMGPRSITVAQLCHHFEQRELAKENVWRSYATKKTYRAYLTRWILPHWRQYELAEVRIIRVESWLRSLPLAKSSCAKIRNLMSVLFNHACRYELFDRNPIYLVRQSAKRRRTPTVLMPAEIKALVENLRIRERTLVLLAVSTGLRQSELFGLKWGDIDVAQRTMNVTRSIVYGAVGTCKTESSQKPVPIHPLLAESLLEWRKHCIAIKPDDWVFASKRSRGRKPYWGQAILRKYVRPVAEKVGIQKCIGWHTFRHYLSSLTMSSDSGRGPFKSEYSHQDVGSANVSPDIVLSTLQAVEEPEELIARVITCRAAIGRCCLGESLLLHSQCRL
jgi:integrase